jgi:hypothetical protein
MDGGILKEPQEIFNDEEDAGIPLPSSADEGS